MIAVFHRKTSVLKQRILDLDFPTQVIGFFCFCFLSSLPLGGVEGYHLLEYKTQVSRYDLWYWSVWWIKDSWLFERKILSEMTCLRFLNHTGLNELVVFVALRYHVFLSHNFTDLYLSFKIEVHWVAYYEKLL